MANQTNTRILRGPVPETTATELLADPNSDEAKRFREALRAVLSVSKDDVDRMVAEEKEARTLD